MASVSLDELADFLNSDRAPPGCMDLSELDGFLAGLVAGPEVVPEDEWLVEVWDNEEPDYADAAEQGAVEQAILDRYGTIEAGLDATPLTYTVILWQDESRHRSGRGLGGRLHAGCNPARCRLATSTRG